MKPYLLLITLLFCGCATTLPPLKATLMQSKDPLAIIGGKVYHQGDFIDSYRRIEKIELEKVTLSNGQIITADLREYK